MAPLGLAALVQEVGKIPRYDPMASLPFSTHISLWCYVQGLHLSVASISFPPCLGDVSLRSKKLNQNSEHLEIWDWDAQVHASYKAGSHISARPRVMSHVFCQTKQNKIIVSPKPNHSVPQSSSSSSSSPSVALVQQTRALLSLGTFFLFLHLILFYSVFLWLCNLSIQFMIGWNRVSPTSNRLK